ncbi:branched-chain amino acid transport system II carrier protein [Peptoniphilus sp. MSJ-1]|uniref:Branched-chain amino acid transport system carrier protein n=1 Tax=Peptoniphilus ovalis TaxID=2841503 RepID=A0ABS6FJ44_9FIRM|nr:branched-chain amino acid transport system II carrier protein [Peptoniphilus ovalis]MBU5670024.1 branched-chain amino acid transport system II carrier protein [Peptoniphilus ovalis]
MKKLSKSQFSQVSIMLFGLFFGAGNLIFPPLLGNQAGSNTFVSLLSFSVTAVLFPIFGAIAVGKTDGLKNLANRVNPIFSLVFTTAIYLSIGPGLGIPRAGSVPFEMAIAPYIPASFNMNLARLVYTFVFFAIAMWICLKPNKLVERVGKYLTPVLILLITIMFVRVMFLPKEVAVATGDYLKAPVVKGFLAGYETMDAVAALNFGFVVTLAIRRFGIEDKKDVTKYTVKAGLVAGFVLFVIYAMLSTIGAVTSKAFAGSENGAVVLTEAVKLVLGNSGLVLLAMIFTLACLTTCVGLISSGSEYFYTLFKKKLSYSAWVVIWTLFSFLMANFGLNNLLALSVTLLTIIYPVALVLIAMGITSDFVNYSKLTYKATALFSVGFPLISVLSSTLNVNLPLLTNLEKSLPLSQYGLSWLLPTLAAIVCVEFAMKLSSVKVLNYNN